MFEADGIQWVVHITLRLRLKIHCKPGVSTRSLSPVTDHSSSVTFRTFMTHLHGPVVIHRPCKDGRLSWPGWLVTYQDGCSSHYQLSSVESNLSIGIGTLLLNQTATNAEDKLPFLAPTERQKQYIINFLCNWLTTNIASVVPLSGI